MSQLEERYRVILNQDSNTDSNIGTTNNDTVSLSTYIDRYPKIVYRVYERYGYVLELRGQYRYISFSSREEALLSIKRIGEVDKVYAVIEEVSVYGDGVDQTRFSN